MGTCCIESGVHCHHDVVVLVSLNVCSHRITERFAAHDRAYHLNRKVSRALERRASAQLDNLGSALCNVNLHLLPLLFCECGSTDYVSQLLAVYRNVRTEHCHLLSVTAVSRATFHLALHYVELLCKRALKACGVKSCESGNLRRFQTGIKQSNQSGKVSGVEDDNHVLNVRAIFLDILAQSLCNLAVAFEQVLTCHARLTRSAA